MKAWQRVIIATLGGYLAIAGCRGLLPHVTPSAGPPLVPNAGPTTHVASVYVTDGSKLVVYGVGQNAPTRTLDLGATAYGVAVDSYGDVYVAEPGQNSVAVYSPGAETLLGTISMPSPTGLAIDQDDTLYAASGSGSFYEFPYGQNKPLEVVPTGGNELGITTKSPDDVFVDSIDGGPSLVQEYVNTMHVHAMIGAATPAGLAFDAFGFLNVGAANYIYTYKMPMTWLPQPVRKHFYPIGNNVRMLSRGRDGNLYVPVFGAAAVDIYPPGSVKAVRRITTGLSTPMAAAEG